MTSIRFPALAFCAALLPALAAGAPAYAESSSLTGKLNAYVGCLNRLSERAYLARERYFSWVGKKGPTGKERIIYGTYTIYDTSECKSEVEIANMLDPRNGELEHAASAYVDAVVALEPLLKEADDYYSQEDYKDDKMAKGKALHPKLVAAWTSFANADTTLRSSIDVLQDMLAVEEIVNIESTEGRKARYHIQALMMHAKRLVRVQNTDKPDLKKITETLGEYEAMTTATETYANENKDDKIGSSFINSAKTFLITSKQLMRRVRDKVPYSTGEEMILNSGGGAWMVEGSPGRLMHDYNQLVDSYNRGARF
ncbi:YiiG family protein [Hyphomicrobium sp.]|uniref:YiiG family protein n=3 Tax=Hyphomicrobium sp. TaxID=82 RepID=UPI002C896616|nr:YiiG family protein [Hyphomicrobium sp.]HRQ26046.1 YiiG family protein [Hyphomicrobium sp.]